MENPIKMDDLGGKPTIFGNIHNMIINPNWAVRVQNLAGFLHYDWRVWSSTQRWPLPKHSTYSPLISPHFWWFKSCFFVQPNVSFRSRYIYFLLKLTVSHLKIWFPTKGKNRLPTTHFSEAFAVRFREGLSETCRWLLPKLRERPIYSHGLCAFKCLVVRGPFLQQSRPVAEFQGKVLVIVDLLNPSCMLCCLMATYHLLSDLLYLGGGFQWFFVFCSPLLGEMSQFDTYVQSHQASCNVNYSQSIYCLSSHGLDELDSPHQCLSIP